MQSRTRKLALASGFGTLTFVIMGLLLPPVYADYFIGIEAVIMGLGFMLMGRFGATYVGVINGLLTTPVRLAFFPFSLILSVLFGLMIDAFGVALGAKKGPDARTGRMSLTMTIATGLTGLIAYYSTSVATQVFPVDTIIVVTILGFGTISGAVAGVVTARLWNRNLKARFASWTATGQESV